MASSSSFIPPKPNQQCQMKQETRNWLELPSDVTASILCRIGVDNILENAQKVCTGWCKICKDDPSMWRVIHMQTNCYRITHPPFPNVSPRAYKEKCKVAVDRSQGQLVDISIVGFCDNELLQYVADRSRHLRRLEISYCCDITCQNWTEALKKLPLLEELNLTSTEISKDAIETVGRCCPMLKNLGLNLGRVPCWYFFLSADVKVMAVVENFRELRLLELIGDSMTNHGLKAILDGCPHLESLDLRECFNIDMHGGQGLWKRCIEQIKCLKLPDDDSLEGSDYGDSDKEI